MAWACPGLASVSQGHSGSVEFPRSDDAKRPDMQHGAVRGNGCQLCAHAAARASLTVQKARWPGLVPGLASVSGRNLLPEAQFFSVSAGQPPRAEQAQALPAAGASTMGSAWQQGHKIGCIYCWRRWSHQGSA